jgi:hypothetical protein
LSPAAARDLSFWRGQRALSFAVFPIDPVNLMDGKIRVNSLSNRGEERVFTESREYAKPF